LKTSAATRKRWHWRAAANLPIALATLRIIKPTEKACSRQIADNEPDAILVRICAPEFFIVRRRRRFPLLGDYSLNVSNELTADLLLKSGLSRLVHSYDLNWNQLRALLNRIDQHFSRS